VSAAAAAATSGGGGAGASGSASSLFFQTKTHKSTTTKCKDENSTHTHERKGNACFEPHFSSFVMSTDVSVGKSPSVKFPEFSQRIFPFDFLCV
jgi:hypothetical protein